MMTERGKKTSPAVDNIDQLFVSLGETSAPPPPAIEAPVPLPENTPEPLAAADTDAEPPISPSAALAEQTPRTVGPLGDLSSEYDWLRQERKRLEEYTLTQFNLIAKQRQEFIAQRSEMMMNLALREQEVNRMAKLLTDRGEAIQIREKVVNEVEGTLAARQEQSATLEQHIARLQTTADRLLREVEHQRLQVEQWRVQATHWQEQVRSAQSDFAAFQQTLVLGKSKLEEEEGRLLARRDQLEHRFAALEKSEEAQQSREADLANFEVRLQREMEEHEREIALAYEQLHAARRNTYGNRPTTPAPTT